MLLEDGLFLWLAVKSDGSRIGYVIASNANSAGRLVFNFTEADRFNLIAVDPLTGELAEESDESEEE